MLFDAYVRARLSGAVALVAFVATSAQAANKLNVLLIVSDDLRDTVGCYGNTAVKTPNIDRLATRGVRFDHAYAQYPVCNASRTSFLTGMRSEQTGVVDNRTLFRTLLPNVVTLPQLLRTSGWHTTCYGKIFHAGGGRPDAQRAWMDADKSWDEAALFDTTAAGKPESVHNLTGGKLAWCKWAMTPGSDDDQPDGQTAQHSIATMEQQSAAGKPWMVAAGFHRPHDPFISPKRYFDLYPAGTQTIFHDPADATPLRKFSLGGEAFEEAFRAFSDDERQQFQRAYYAGVSFMDAQVGRLIDTMDRLKLWDNTLVIFISDHGYHHNERGWWNKNTLFERSCRVPCIVVAPGGKEGAVCQSLVELVDLYPTVVDYCGVDAPHKLAGTSLRPLLENPTSVGKDAAFTLVARGGRQYGQAARTNRWRYIQWSDGSSELYDQRNDPQEMHDLSADPAHRGDVAKLKKLLARVGPFKPKR